MKKKIMMLVLMLALLGSVFAGCDSKGKNEESSDYKKITFVLDWTPNTNHTGLYTALEKGYFEEEGLTVEVVQPPEDGAEVLVASGKAQFGVSFQDSMAPALSKGNELPITAVAAVLSHNTSGIISRKGEGMTSPKGMEGKNYATWNGAIELATIRHVVEADGGDYEKVGLIPSTVTDEVSALRTRMTDAIWVYYGWAGVKAELSELETDYFSFAEIDPVFDYYTPVIISGDAFLKENPETANAFMRALSRGYEFAIDNPQEAAEILCKAAPELDPELVLASQMYLKDYYKDESTPWGYINPDRWNRFYQWVNDNQLTEKEVLLDTGFSNEYLPE